MKTKIITGTVVWKDLEMGFWGIIDSQGKEYYPMNLPKSCQKDGKVVKLEIEEQPDAMTMIMWGTPAKVIKDL